jgi:hemerythrin-like domain-containing protein
MKPRGMLMIEHRLIEKMLRVADREVRAMEETSFVDPVFIDGMVDFIRAYADRTHHGKEEDILFTALDGKEMEGGDADLMAELIQDHRNARETVRGLVHAKETYLSGEIEALVDVKEKMKWLVDFYPVHIAKEDKTFFPATERYFTGEELGAMLSSFLQFDARMIHEKYNRVLEELSQTRR